jgi:arabinogalactan oligomer/maltooligosaccharide transport system substrate-binding protein
MKHKLFLIMSILIIASMVLAACATTETEEPTEVAPEPTEEMEEPTEEMAEPTEEMGEVVTITIWNQWNDEYAANIATVFDDYMAENPNVKIDLSKPEDVSNALNVAIPAGEGPDIIAWANDQIGAQALVGNIVPLNEWVSIEDLEAVYTEPGVRGVTWQDQIWGLPETMEGIALVFNADLVTEEYLPTDPMDFADLLDKATKFQEDTGLVLVCNQGLGNPDAYHVAPVYFGFGVPEYVDDQGNAYLNSPEAMEAGEWMVEFSQVSLAETSHELCLSNVSEGKAGSWWTGPWAIADLEKNGINYTILPMGKPFVGIKTLLMTKNAVDRGNEAIALDVMQYFTSPEVQAKLALINKTIPAQKAALEDPEVAALPTLAGFGASLSLGVPMANTPYASAQWGPVGDATTAIWSGAQAVEEALNAGQTAIEDAIAQMQ